MKKEIDTLFRMYSRTINNCHFYENEKMAECLLNEIGVLRGISYALETFNICPHNNPEYLRLIKLQETMKRGDYYKNELQ